jgi:AAA+ superfamily predicted ATPase
MQTTIPSDKLKTLFQAYRDQNDEAFLRIAEGIISEELAANHYNSANELQRALGKGRKSVGNTSKVAQLTTLPLKDRRNGEELLLFSDTPQRPVVFLSDDSRKKIDRILEEHRRSNVLRKHGYSPKTKLLFWGPPGCGKTLTAHYLAYELGLPLGVVRLSAVISSFLGDTASHLHRVFTRANSTPMVLLLDEADALAKHRDDQNDVGELKRVVNSFLQSLDAFTGKQSILVAASNHQYLFDPALWRRFDDVVEFTAPETSQREQYLKFLLNGLPFDGLLAEVARRTASLSYIDINNVVIESVKTMLLDDRKVLQSREVLAELTNWKLARQKALKRAGAKSK